MLSNTDKNNIRKANVAYLDQYGNLKALNSETNIMESNRANYSFVDISKYGLKELYGSPIMSEEEEGLTIKRKDSNLICLEGNHYLEKYPVLTEIYQLAERAKDKK